MKQAVLAVHFGTNRPDAKKEMDSMDTAIRTAAAETAFFPATAGALEEGLSTLEREGYTHVVVQTTYLLDGIKYREIRSFVNRWKSKFIQLLLADPLLSSTADLKRLADGLNQLYHSEGNRMFVMIGHGTNCFSNAVYPALQGIFHMMGRDDIVVGTVEGFPDLENVLNYLSSSECTRLHLIPLMMTAGKHAYHDIAGEKDSWKSRLEQAGYTVSCTMQGLSQLPQVQEIVAQHLMDVMRKIK